MSVQKSVLKSTSKVVATEIEILVKPQFVEDESKIDSNYFFFSYKVTILNKGNSPAQLMSRHWIITDGNGQVEEVRGAGVIGQQPKINPGQKFEYESACPLVTSSGSMRGSYQMSCDDGSTFEVSIPEFFLIAPFALH